MKKLLGFIVSFAVVLFLYPDSVSAGEMIEATCTNPDDKRVMVFDFDSSGGKQEIAGLGKADVKFTKNKIIVKFKGGIAAFNITNGKMFFNGEHEGVICKYDNLAALENKSTPSVSSNGKEGAVIKLLKSMKSQLDRIEKSLPKF